MTATIIRFVSEDWKDALARSAEAARVELFCAETPEARSAAARKVQLYNARLKDIVELDERRGKCR